MTLATRPAYELAPLIRQKQVSPVELMRAVLDRIGQFLRVGCGVPDSGSSAAALARSRLGLDELG